MKKLFCILMISACAYAASAQCYSRDSINHVLRQIPCPDDTLAKPAIPYPAWYDSIGMTQAQIEQVIFVGDSVIFKRGYSNFCVNKYRIYKRNISESIIVRPQAKAPDIVYTFSEPKNFLIFNILCCAFGLFMLTALVFFRESNELRNAGIVNVFVVAILVVGVVAKLNLLMGSLTAIKVFLMILCLFVAVTIYGVAKFSFWKAIIPLVATIAITSPVVIIINNFTQNDPYGKADAQNLFYLVLCSVLFFAIAFFVKSAYVKKKRLA